MATTIITTNTFGSGPLFTYAAIGDHLVIIPGITLGSSVGTTIAGTGFNEISLTIMGTLISRGFPVFSGNDAVIQIGVGGSFICTEQNSGNTGMFLSGNNVTLTNDGSYFAPTTVGILSQGDNKITNTGSILAATPLLLGLVGGANDMFVNSGTVTANGFADAATDHRFNNAVLAEGSNNLLTNLASGTLTANGTEAAGVRFNDFAGGSMLRNYGQITSQQDYGVNLSTVDSGQAMIAVQNWGTITGLDGSYNGSVNTDFLRNRGQMNGDVQMGDGADTFDNRGGTVEGDINLGAGNDIFSNRGGMLSGTVFGGDGNDIFRTNVSEDEVLSGGAGTADRLEFSNDAGAILALDGTFENAGAARGDTYTDMEHVFGSASAADRIRGNGSANYLFSSGGNDTLDGAGGNDILRGGTGRDNLTGGGGNDTFRFMTLTEAGDVIKDFSSAASGNNDRFQISAAGFGGGLAAGALAQTAFRSRADNLAQDANDRFIFRTTDQTLWYDADGNGSGASLMIADLQAGANVTYLDILLM